MELHRELIVRVFVGPKDNPQEVCFMSAWKESRLCKEGAIKECHLYHDDVKAKKWGQAEIIEWLKGSDIHFILCHMHQGIKHTRWDCFKLCIDLMELDFHLGFPMAEHLCCPIFTQNKLNYLSALRDADRISYTMAIELSSFRTYSRHQQMLVFPFDSIVFQWNNCEEIIYDLQQNCQEAGLCKWVLKFPFMTNGNNIKYCKDFESLTDRILECNDEDFDNGLSVPYGLVQPCLTNGKEYKIIVLDGKAIFHTVKNNGQSKAFSDTETLYEFAETSLRILKSKRPGTISDGMVRVDIMQRNDGKMIVNEFEGFEAGFGLNGSTDAKVMHCLTKFWANKLQHIYELS